MTFFIKARDEPYACAGLAIVTACSQEPGRSPTSSLSSVKARAESSMLALDLPD
ncbi:hypothetical protein ACFFYR_00820 [Paraburkholderia dipogonis]|uniref:hypothetical protein n=1 Tax=Paraburkholderia dipogonis TaxID=1211383 RepID=UPI00141AED25|nr:hypothetical protein [Paraburkholderia dipogonis]